MDLLNKISLDTELESLKIPENFDPYKLTLADITKYSLKLMYKSLSTYPVREEHFKVNLLCICTDENYYNYGVPINNCRITILTYNYKENSVLAKNNGLYFQVTVDTIDDGPLCLNHKCYDIKEAEYLTKCLIKESIDYKFRFFKINLGNFCDKYGLDKKSELFCI